MGFPVGGQPAPDASQFIPPPTDKKEEKKEAEKTNEAEPEAEVEQEQEVETEAEEEADNEDEEGGGEGGGGADTGAGDDDGSGGFSGNQQNSDDAIDLDGLSGTTRTIATTATRATATAVVTDDISTSTTGGTSLKFDPSTKFLADTPVLNAAGHYDLGEVQASFKGNPWLGSSFLVTLTMNMMEIAKIQKKVKLAESEATKQMMTLTMTLAKEIGDLIMAKAEREAQMHKNMAIFAIVSLSIAVVGFALQMVGVGLSVKSKNMDADAEAQKTATPDTPETQKVNAGAGQPKSVTIKDSPDAPANAQGPDVDNSSAKPTQKEIQKSEFSATRDQKAQINRNNAKADMDADATPAGTKINDSTGIDEAGPKSAQEAKVGTSHTDQVETGGNTSPAKKSATDLKKEANELGGIAQGYSAAGDFLTRGLADHLEKILSNFEQADAKIDVGKLDQATEIRRAAAQIVRQGLESASRGFTDATQAIDTANQMLQKIQDETMRAHTLGRG